MKKYFILLSIILLQINNYTNAQVIFGIGVVSISNISFADSNTYPANIIRDTATAPLWQLGRTHKNFFATDSTGTRAIMTDTLHHYPVNANNYFVLKILPASYNQIITFWHKYQTDSLHAGGIVEYSTDTGLTWQNVKGACNTDDVGYWSPGIRTDSFYAKTDTLLTGEPSFMGTRSSRMSRIQFLGPMPVDKHNKTTLACSTMMYSVPWYVLVRFRFKSDATTDSLAGWLIDSIQLESDNYPGLVKDLNKLQSIKPYPNPSASGIFNFPELDNENEYTIEINNMVGEKVAQMKYTRSVDIQNLPQGIYFYKVSNGTDSYYGKLLRE